MFFAATKFYLALLAFLLFATNVELRIMSRDKILWNIPCSSQGDLSCSPSNASGLSGRLGSILNNSYLLRLKQILRQFWNANLFSFGNRNNGRTNSGYSNDISGRNEDNYNMVFIPINDDKPAIPLNALKLDSHSLTTAQTQTNNSETNENI